MDRFIALALRQGGYEPHLLPVGGKLLPALLVATVDATVLEASFPLVDVFALCARLRAVSVIPIVLLLYRDEAHRQAEALQMGASAGLILPVDAEELLACVRSVVPQEGTP